MNTGQFELNPLMLPITARNQVADAFFYDVSSLTAQERLALSLRPWIDQKGGILVVSPGSSSESIQHYKHPLDFIINGSALVEAIVVAGVGSSALGTAALARNVADTYGIRVAGIVSGYGMSDVMLEGLGGWFLYGKIDQLRFDLEGGMKDFNALLSKAFPNGCNGMPLLKNLDFPIDDYVPPSLDISHLNEIMLVRYLNTTKPKMKIKLLLGHSKGSLLISSALNHLNQELMDVAGKNGDKPDLTMHNLVVVTVGAVTDIPLTLAPQQFQFLGDLDMIGRTNSRSRNGSISNDATWIPGAGHHLNTKIPGFLDLKSVLKQYVSTLPEIPDADQPWEECRKVLYQKTKPNSRRSLVSSAMD